MPYCAICHSQHWDVFSTLHFGIWQSEDRHLTRDSQEFPLGCCQDCGHVQNLADYDDTLLNRLYFHSPQEEVFWHQTLIGSDFPYCQMVDMFVDLIPPKPAIADLGCGPGKLLKACQRRIDSASLFGVDFNDRCSLEGITYQRANLTDPSALAQLFPTKSLDLILSSHTLEHLPDPLGFLIAIKTLLKPEGHLFIEVPDFSEPQPWELVGQSSLVNQQHIHYFSKASLTLLASLCGYDVIKQRQLTTGFIPRLQFVLKPVTHKTQFVVKQALNDIHKKHLSLLSAIESALTKGEDVHLWGVGADLYQLLQLPRFQSLLTHPNLMLDDNQWAGCDVQNKAIAASSVLEQTQGPIFITPSLAETRVKMKQVAKQFSHRLIDAYEQQASHSQPQCLCALCKSNTWQPIETLITGNWRNQSVVVKSAADNSTLYKNNPQEKHALTRDILELPIGICSSCGHVQITRAYGEAEIALLYFSSEGAPDMWPAGLANAPYDDMTRFIGESLLNSASIADFGCGAGLLLKAMQQQHPSAEYLGFDFHPQHSASGLTVLRCDLNQSNELINAAFPKQFDLIVSSHVLEHLINPVEFLSCLKQRLTTNGQVFIEVPDSTFNPSNRLHETNLIHGQHIHYYTEETLLTVAAMAGFECVKLRRFHTGTIPRMQVLLRGASSTPLFARLGNTAQRTIVQRFDEYRKKQQQLMQRITLLLQEKGALALWGVGGDLYLLLKAFPELEAKIAAGNIRLFDANLHGKCYLGAIIEPSDTLSQCELPILMTPIYWPTRSRMQSIAQTSALAAIDPYQDEQ